MKATKYTVTIKIEVLSMYSVAGLLAEVNECIEKESQKGLIMKDDGDEVTWDTETNAVEF